MNKCNQNKIFSKNTKVCASICLIVVVVLTSNVWSDSIVKAQSVGNQPPPPPTTVPARTLQSQLEPSTNPNSSAFRIAVCDGPSLPKDVTGAYTQFSIKTMAEFKAANNNRDYVPCDFDAVILLVQHLINIMMVLGVLVAILMLSYAGLLYISGQKAKIDKAHSIFPKIFLGFIIMLSAWFIVYQILSWLTDNSGFKTLLGSP
ncbi:MAG: hypothetical protein A3C79_01660 [Candidatus Taylorbacteria bacterium RIFCSPHIGHO2_02_FULL_45_28]|uniref:Uncharacterized protein n=1 Tax=Candidatus Taylorbacteria bacterium RIFCSPHIGHO2_12_FULL_45_16 TaxID=1802315 RepID=A0A1G2MYS1_9BACT|nr:MAG: hypothetical protein A2830_03815 [Candidatus Taylorbacteria bacterium RIFCSPHIGHO2_01_FULL_44_110]OHA25141.1 MAG: hypothetical protein A3C79_01660 [Candidatus Taylorbacteria bacterium RIFCSPHIGHO2_02_FULL_45_28]OHA29020.1 MAG: hypothetical protein A3F51_02035 [Candidatus Taylorbacteria bacterium RIFCSPHIGHO2_12_FULL_45_16]OHA33139.1 MAG: hypothetical protein A3A23_03720 [Candidatus Taylorbacteria bacterium RIFCSPLOWO2_01_FULL_45_59]OHA39562.1 MAG: hypothetical protein A3I98_00300 [Candi